MARKTIASLFALTCCGLALLPATASATDIPVTTTTDVSMEDDLCSLREAIQAAQTNTAQGTMGAVVDCPAGATADDLIQLGAMTYTIASTTSGAGGSENLNANGDFDMDFTTDPGFLRIDGVLGAAEVPSTIIDGTDLDRIFDVQNGGTTTLEIKEMTLRNGKPPEPTSHGGAILIRDDDAQFALTTARVEDSDALGWGGGMSVNSSAVVGADVDITQVEFSGNDAVDDGGALWIDGPEDQDAFNIRRSAFISNHTDQMGGAIYIKQDGDTNDEPVVGLFNSTLSLNTADVDGGAIAFAFGLGGTLFTEFTTIANNSTTAAMQAGGIATTDGINEFIQGSGMILSGNTSAGMAANCTDTETEFSGGGGVESGPVACFPGSTVADPGLAALSYNATGDQTTRTQAITSTSSAANLLAAASCDSMTDIQGVDQRGIARPIGSLCDAGAFEAPLPPPATPITPVTPIIPTTTAAPAPATKKCKKKRKKRAAAAKKCKKKKKKR